MNTFLLDLRKRFIHFLKRHDLFKYWFFIRNLFLITAKYLNVISMIFVFFINPLKLYKFSWRNCLPSSNKRDEYKDNLLDLYRPKVSTNFKYINHHAKIFFRGFTEKVRSFTDSQKDYGNKVQGKITQLAGLVARLNDCKKQIRGTIIEVDKSGEIKLCLENDIKSFQMKKISYAV